MKTIASFLIALCLLTGCGTLDPGGAYDSKPLYTADASIVAVHDTLHAYVQWEYQMRGQCSEAATKHADYIRLNVAQWRDTVMALRDAFAANPSEQNRAALDRYMAVIRTALTQATIYMTQ